MAIYNAYLEGAEREAAILEMELDNQYDKLSMLYEMSMMELNQIKKDLELKVFKESGTYDDLEYLISEAEDQAAQDQKNILSQILDWFSRAIQKMVTGIKNFFAGAKDVPDNTMVDAPEEFFDNDKDSKASKILNMISGIDENTAPNFLESSIGKILGVGVAAGAVFVINRAVKNSKKVQAKAIKDEVKKAQGMENQVNAVVTKIKQVLDKAANLPVIGQFCTTAKGILDNTVKPITDWLQDKIAWGGELLKNNPAVQAAANAAGNAADAVKGAAGAVANGVKGAAGNVANAVKGVAGNAGQAQPQAGAAATVNGAKVEGTGAGARIVATFTDNSSGQPVARKVYLNKDGKVTGSGDGKPIPANAKSIIEGSEAVRNAAARITKAAEKTAMKNSPNAQMTQNNEAAEDLRLELGDSYTVEIAEDDVIDVIINEAFDVPEDYLTTTQSIFGIIAEREAAEDPEFEELQKLFSEL